MRRTFPFAAMAQPRRRNTLTLAGTMFALGLAAGAVMRPSLMPHAPEPALAAAHRNEIGSDIGGAIGSEAGGETALADTPLAKRLDPSLTYPAEVIRVLDGDTFEARVRVWPGLDVDTKVRLRGIDAAELHARCAEELAQAQAARTALQRLLADGGVAISRVGVDKYGGRVDAAVATRSNADVSAELLQRGLARSYDGGKRGSWCG